MEGAAGVAPEKALSGPPWAGRLAWTLGQASCRTHQSTDTQRAEVAPCSAMTSIKTWIGIIKSSRLTGLRDGFVGLMMMPKKMTWSVVTHYGTPLSHSLQLRHQIRYSRFWEDEPCWPWTHSNSVDVNTGSNVKMHSSRVWLNPYLNIHIFNVASTSSWCGLRFILVHSTSGLDIRAEPHKRNLQPFTSSMQRPWTQSSYIATHTVWQIS